MAQAPWTVTPSDINALRAVGLTEPAILHVVVLASYFNYLNRVADAVDMAFDYESPLPRMVKDPSRAPLPVPPPRIPEPPPLPMRLADRPVTAQAFAQWRDYVMQRTAPLSQRDRRVLALAAAGALADGATTGELADAAPRDARERLLAEYATTLTSTPWRLSQTHVEQLHSLGLDDAGVLDVISVASFQNTASRLRAVLAEV